VNHRGALKFRMKVAGKLSVRRFAHHLVLEAFVGPRPRGLECRHLNGNAKANYVGNLVWGTAKENAEDRMRHGTTARGGRICFCRLTPEEVLLIWHSSGTHRALGKRHGVAAATVGRIKIGKTWGWLTRNHPRKEPAND
jgi:hypothetical protein